MLKTLQAPAVNLPVATIATVPCSDSVSLADSLSVVVNSMKGIALCDMEKVRLMNRTDTKYLLPARKLKDILLRAAPFYVIQEVEGIRIASYETLYFDTPDLKFFIDHINGKLNRKKVRIRSYRESNLHFLEVKRKTNSGKTNKNRIRTGQNGNPEEFGEEAYALVRQYASMDLFLLFPTLISRFKRITLVNHGRTERVTIDFDLDYGRVGTSKEASLPLLGIIEIKREKFSHSPIGRILREARVKKCGISKYCLGIRLNALSPKTNLYKRKIRYIQKLTNNEPHV